MGGINEGKIGEDAMSRAIQTLNNYKQKCIDFQTEEIYAFGTSAVRSASNKWEFLMRVKQEAGLIIQVISGMQEAELIYAGVSSGYEFETNGLIMDIGGGSTEFIWADGKGIKEAASFEVGVSRIYQLYQFDDPYSANDISKVERYLDQQIGSFFESVNTDILIGASGSFETFYELVHEQPYPDNVYMELDREQIMPALEKIIHSTQAERDENPHIIPIRKKMAPIAAIKIQWIMRKLDISKIVISPYSLKEGVIETLR